MVVERPGAVRPHESLSLTNSHNLSVDAPLKKLLAFSRACRVAFVSILPAR